MNRLRDWSIPILLWLGCASGVAHADGSAEGTTLTFGVVPQQAASTLVRSWGPVLRYLEQKTGYRFVFRTAPDIPTFEQRLAAGEYDFAYMNPYHFVAVNRGEAGYQAIARAKDKKIRGILVVRKDSPLSQLQELDGKELAFPAPAAFANASVPWSVRPR